MLCDISGSMEPYARAYLQFLTCAAGGAGRERRGVRVRDPADAADARARLAQPRAGDPARRGGGAGLVERHPDRRRAEGVQRPPRPARHGARRGDRDPVRRLGARRPGARRPRDGAAARGSPTGSCGSTRASRAAASRRAPAAWSRRCRTATRWSAATASRRSSEVVDAIGAARGAGGRARGPSRDRRQPRPRRSRGRARRPSPGSSVAMPSGYGPSRGSTTPGMVARERLSDARAEDLHLPGLRAPGGAAAPARRPAAELLRPRGAQRADRPPGAPAAERARRGAVEIQRQRGGGSDG